MHDEAVSVRTGPLRATNNQRWYLTSDHLPSLVLTSRANKRQGVKDICKLDVIVFTRSFTSRDKRAMYYPPIAFVM